MGLYDEYEDKKQHNYLCGKNGRKIILKNWKKINFKYGLNENNIPSIGIYNIEENNDFLNFMEDKFITKISNLDDEDLKYKVHNDFESLRDRYIKDNKVDRQHNGSSTSKDFLNEKQKYVLAQASLETSIGNLIF